jgi:hypothetical protein
MIFCSILGDGTGVEGGMARKERKKGVRKGERETLIRKYLDLPTAFVSPRQPVNGMMPSPTL